MPFVPLLQEGARKLAGELATKAGLFILSRVRPDPQAQEIMGCFERAFAASIQNLLISATSKKTDELQQVEDALRFLLVRDHLVQALVEAALSGQGNGAQLNSLIVQAGLEEDGLPIVWSDFLRDLLEQLDSELHAAAGRWTSELHEMVKLTELRRIRIEVAKQSELPEAYAARMAEGLGGIDPTSCLDNRSFDRYRPRHRNRLREGRGTVSCLRP